MVDTRKRKPQWISTAHVVADMDGVQSRAQMSKDDEREFSEIMRSLGEWGAFPPLTIYFDGKKHWLADGFHRYFAAKRAGLQLVLADVKEGTKDDAIIASAGSNIRFSIKRTSACKHRAVRMMLPYATEKMWTITRIAEHCGVSPAFAAKVAREFKSGLQELKPRMPAVQIPEPKNSQQRPIENKADGEEDDEYLDVIGVISSQSIQRLFAKANLLMHPLDAWTRAFGLSAFVGHGFSVACEYEGEANSLALSIARVIAASRLYPSHPRKVVLRHSRKHASSGKLVSLYRTADGGIEFMTPSEFVQTCVESARDLPCYGLK